ncbi:MAG: hypothetical protein ACK53L_02780, partial [Pirellulaceae bacterium]
RKYSDISATLQRVEKYLGNPGERVSVEIKTAIGSADTLPNQERLADDPEVGRLVELFMTKEHREMEIKAFFEAWEGAIRHARFLPATADIHEIVNVLLTVNRHAELPDISSNPLF